MNKIIIFVVATLLGSTGIAWGTVAAVNYGTAVKEAYKAKQKECDDAWFGRDGKGQRFVEACRLP